MEIKLPQWGMAMNEGTVVSWLVSEGDAVEAGQELVEIEAAKTTQTVSTPVAGTVGQILVGEDETVAPKTVLCTIEPVGSGGGESAPEGSEDPGGDGPPPSPADEVPARAEVPDEAPAAVDADAAEDVAGESGGQPAGGGGPRGSVDAPPASPADEVPAQAEVPAEAPAAVAPSSGRVQVAPRARKMAKDAGLDLDRVTGSGPNGRIVVADVEAALSGAADQATGTDAGTATDAGTDPGAGRLGRVEVVPLARKMAKDADLDLDRVTGSGRGGRILPGDVQAALDSRDSGAGGTAAPSAGGDQEDTSDEPQVGPDGATLPQDAPPVPEGSAQADAAPAAPAAAPTTGAGSRGRGTSRMRTVIAERMLSSLQTTAQFTITTTADVTDVVAYRASITGPKPSFTDFVVRACALALRDHPDVNVRFEDGRIVPVDDVNVGVAVAVDGGLMVPVVHGADRLGLAELAERTRDLAERARDGGLTADELSDGTFTVTSLGGQGIDAFTPILSPPESAILGVGRTKDAPTRYDDQVVWRQEMTLSLTLDHRAVDGYPGALFLARVVELLARPRSLV